MLGSHPFFASILVFIGAACSTRGYPSRPSSLAPSSVTSSIKSLAPIFESFRVDLVDAHGAFKLVDENWAEFTVRMGIRSKEKALTRLEFAHTA